MVWDKYDDIRWHENEFSVANAVQRNRDLRNHTNKELEKKRRDPDYTPIPFDQLGKE